MLLASDYPALERPKGSNFSDRVASAARNARQAARLADVIADYAESIGRGLDMERQFRGMGVCKKCGASSSASVRKKNK